MKDINLIKQMFDFIEQQEGLRTPLIFKLLHAPETITAEDLHVDGSLNLRDTPITSLPPGLSVGEDLDLWNTSVTSLPERLSVGGWLDLRRTPLAEEYKSEQIRAMIESKGGKVGGGILV